MNVVDGLCEECRKPIRWLPGSPMLCSECSQALVEQRVEVKQSAEYDIVENIIRFEMGDMTRQEVIELFQRLIDTRLVYSLQGMYQRAALDLIDAGLVHVE